MSEPGKFRFVSSDRRVREDRRFVAGKGNFAADIVPAGRQARRAGDVPASGRAHRVDRQERGAGDAGRALRARRQGAGGGDGGAVGRPRHAERAAPAARGGRRALCRRMGRGGGRRQPRARRGRRRGGAGRIRAAAVRARCRAGLRRRHAGARGARLERAARPHLRLGRGRAGLRRQPAHLQAPRQMGPQRHGADRDLRRDGKLGSLARGARRLGLDPDAEIPRSARLGAEAAGLGRARALRRRRRRQLRRQARHQARRAGRLPLEAARLSGAADRGSAREHARRRHARPGARCSMSRSPTTTTASSAR